MFALSTTIRGVSGAGAMLAVALVLAGCRLPRETVAAPVSRPGAAPAAAQAEARASSGLAERVLGGRRYALPAALLADPVEAPPRRELALLLTWPELAPRANPADESTDFRREIVILLQPLPAGELAAIPERFVRPLPGQGAGNPVYDIAERLRQPDVHGLEHYVVDEDKRARYRATAERDPPTLQSHAFGTGADWYIARDDTGRIRTVILCDPVERPDDDAAADEAQSDALCDGHSFALPEYGLWVKAGYRYPALRDWKRLEDAVIRILRSADRGPVPTDDRPGP